MPIEYLPSSVFRAAPPPLWYVSNGELTVGPVVTDLLKRGVEHRRVPDHCYVRPLQGDWRTLTGVREVCRLWGMSSTKLPSTEQVTEWSRPMRSMRDEDELWHAVADLAVLATGAECAMLHVRRGSARPLVTRAVSGPISRERLSHALPDEDHVLAAARQRRPVIGPPYGAAEDALAKRFARSQGGVGAAAMIPILVGNALSAMLELSRPGHAFRRADLKRAERLVQRVICNRAN